MIRPVIVGVAELMLPATGDATQAKSVIAMLTQVARAAEADAGAGLTEYLDTIAVTRTFSDSAAPLKSKLGTQSNIPRAVANAIGAPQVHAVYAAGGGQVPQALVTEFAEKISMGDCRAVLLAGGEALATEKALRKAKQKVDWTDATEGQLEDRPSGVSDILDLPQVPNDLLSIPAIYAILENARRAKTGLSRRAYAAEIGRLFAPFSHCAAGHPAAQFPQELSAGQITEVDENNPLISTPYTRAMVAKDGVNQAAAVLMIAEDLADELGIAPEKRVYPLCGAEAEDKVITQRADLGRSVAMDAAYQAALKTSGVALKDITCFDLYSCFPIAVFAACEALGLAPDDPRGLTVTGGLPYFGGPGNNYSMHGIVGVVARLRAQGGYGLVGANGGYISKHAVGLYGAAPGDWQMVASEPLAAAVDAQKTPGVDLYPQGVATVESYTVLHSKTGPKRGYVIGRTAAGRRFIGATDKADKDTLQEMLDSDPLGRRIYVSSDGPGQRFTFDARKTKALALPRPKSLEGPFEHCLVARRGNVLEVTINRPEARNCLTPEGHLELEEIFNLYEVDKTLWVAILTGAGQDAFCAGNDLKYTASGNPMWFPKTGFAGLTHRQGRIKPVIAAVNGFAMGGGLETAMACDMIVADAAAQFSLPEAKVGLIAAMGGVPRLTRVIPPMVAREMILTGKRIGAERAAALGLVNQVTEAGQALEGARALAEEICAASPVAVGASLQILNETDREPAVVDAIQAPSAALARVLASEDLQAGLMSFLMKQKPQWKGQ